MFCIIVAGNIENSDCVDGDVRLEGGQTDYEGRVEICVNKVWGTICSLNTRSWWWYGFHWNRPDSDVVCKQMGHMELGIFVVVIANTMSCLQHYFNFKGIKIQKFALFLKSAL